MKNELQQLSSKAAPETSKTWLELGQLCLVLGLVIGVPYAGCKHHTAQNERTARDWLAACSAIRDPWERFTKLKLSNRPSLNDEQAREANRQSDAAMAASLAQGSLAAFEFAERWQGSYGELLDRHPRDPLLRKAQLTTLSIVWPGVEDMAVADRLALIKMAARCHLHEAEEPVDSDTVLNCVRYGAQSLHDEATFARLMDSAQLFRPLTAAP